MSGVLAILMGGSQPFLVSRVHTMLVPVQGAGGPVHIELRFANTGELVVRQTNYAVVTNTSYLPEWGGTPAAGASSFGNDWQLRLTVEAGNAPQVDASTITPGVWHNLTSTLVAHIGFDDLQLPGSQTGTWRIQIRHATTLNVIADAIFGMTAGAV